MGSIQIIASRCALCQDDPRSFRSYASVIDISGQTFHRLTVEHFVGIGRARLAFWCCRCACGQGAIVSGNALRHDSTKSCGCLVHETVNAGQFQPTHGMTNTPLFRTWCNMLTRCLNAHSPDYERYGARGITVCPQWQASFETFLADVGERPAGMTLDRIDVNRPYEPGNVLWSSPREQSNNKRNNHFLTFQGRCLSLAQWAIERDIPYAALCSRVRAGWAVEKILTTPVRIRQRSLPSAESAQPRKGWGKYSHGMSKTRLHRIWRGILNRCLNTRTPAFPDYGGRGIMICERWRQSFLAFYEDVGDAPDGMSLERLDNAGHYEPGNVRWASPLEQANNKRNTRLLRYAGKAQSVAAWAREQGLPLATVWGRLRLGWSVADTLSIPAKRQQGVL